MSDTGGGPRRVSDRVKLLTEALSASAVVLSVVFLAFEVRQNTEEAALNRRAIEVEAYQDLIAQINDLNELGVEYPLVYDDIDRVASGAPGWESIDLNRAPHSTYMWLLFRHADMAFYQYERGLIAEDRMRSAMMPLTGRLFPGGERMLGQWLRRRVNFTPAFRDHLDDLYLEWGIDVRALVAANEAP